MDAMHGSLRFLVIPPHNSFDRVICNGGNDLFVRFTHYDSSHAKFGHDGPCLIIW